MIAFLFLQGKQKNMISIILSKSCFLTKSNSGNELQATDFCALLRLPNYLHKAQIIRESRQMLEI